MIVIDLALILIASALLVPAVVYFVECMSAVIGGVARPLARSDQKPRLAVVVPAHDEQAIIGDTVRHLRHQIRGDERLIVIADNCSDDTASEACNAGAEVWTRNDELRRGKGFAIEFAIERLASDPPDILVFVDADCRLSDGAVHRLCSVALAYQRPAQALYLMAAPRSAGPLTLVSAFAYMIRNLVRPLGLHRLGFPCHLTGTGMAFTWRQIVQTPAQRDNLVEDLTMGLEMAIAGYPPIFCSEVLVQSELPVTRQAASSQRRRWEHGQMATLISHGPRLVMQAFRQHRLDLLILAADLSVPPLALLVTLVIASSIFFGLVPAGSASVVAFTITLFALGLIVFATIAAWVRFGREQIPIHVLIMAPAYLLWKLPVYIAFFVRGRQRTWVRTERSPDKSDKARH